MNYRVVVFILNNNMIQTDMISYFILFIKLDKNRSKNKDENWKNLDILKNKR